VDKLKLTRDVSGNPLFNVLFVLQNFARNEVKLENMELVPYQIPHTTSKFDLSFFAYEWENEMVFAVEYSTNLFKRSTIEQMVNHFIEILKQITGNPHRKLKDIKISHELEAVQVTGIQAYEKDFDF
jgi:non-ribosomal peptide synthetase component F